MSNHKADRKTLPTLTRRRFLRGVAVTGAAVAAPMYIPASALGKGGRVAPSERIVMGCVGTGGRGTSNMRTFLGNRDVQIVAVCDVERKSSRYYRGRVAGRDPAKETVEKHYAKGAASGSFKGCDAYSDFRELLERKDIDAVSVATPDHWHALVSIAAANTGKDVYCEKPLANSIAEGRAIVDAVKRNKRVLQTGSHERSNPNARYAAELVRNGRIGKLRTVRIQMPCTEPHHRVVKNVKDVPPTEPVPGGLDFDFWLGHTPKVDYTPSRCHFWWRFILAHGGGEMTDRGAHVIDLAQMCMDTEDTGPVEIETAGVQGTGLYDAYMDYEYTNVFANGVRMIGTSKGPRGLKLEGEDGWIFIHVHGCKLEAGPKSLLSEKIGEDEIRLGRTTSHHRNFLDCVRSRRQPHAHAEVGHRSASICHLNNIALKVGRKLKWDPASETVTGDAKANSMLSPKMRAPWTI